MKLIAKAEGFTTNAGTTCDWRFYENNGQFFADRDDNGKSYVYPTRYQLDRCIQFFADQRFDIVFFS